VLCAGLAVASDTCSTAFARVYWLWLVLPIPDLLFLFMANAAAIHCLLGRHLKGSNSWNGCCNLAAVAMHSLQICHMFHSHVQSVASKLQDPHNSRMLNIWADDLSCALFGMANSVTAMFYLIDATTGKDALVEGGETDRPPWLGFSVHVFNTIVAWADIFCAHPRSFSERSGRLSVGIIAFYTVWILICSHFNGAFPYPILNKLPWPAVSNAVKSCS